MKRITRGNDTKHQVTFDQGTASGIDHPPVQLLARFVQTGGINYQHLRVGIAANAQNPSASRLRPWRYDRDFLADDAIEQRLFADIRSAAKDYDAGAMFILGDH